MKHISDLQRKHKKIAKIVVLSILLAIVTAIYICIRFFVVEEVAVEGNELYDDDTIKETILNDAYSWNTLYVYLKYTFLDVGEVPFIDTMDVAFVGPTSLKVTVYEKGLIGYTYIDSIEKNAYFDKDGFVIEISDDVIDGVPCITGLGCKSATVYQKLDVTESALKTLLTATQTLEKYDLSPDQIQYKSGGNITLYFGGIQVDMGSSNQFAQKTMRLSKILPDLMGNGILHLDKWSEQSSDVTFTQID